MHERVGHGWAPNNTKQHKPQCIKGPLSLKSHLQGGDLGSVLKYVFGGRKKNGAPSGNLHRHGRNMQNPHRKAPCPVQGIETRTFSLLVLFPPCLEKDVNGDTLWVWCYPSVSSDQRQVLLSKCCLTQDCRDFHTFVFGQFCRAWYYITTVEVQEPTALNKVK